MFFVFVGVFLVGVDEYDFDIGLGCDCGNVSVYEVGIDDGDFFDVSFFLVGWMMFIFFQCLFGQEDGVDYVVVFWMQQQFGKIVVFDVQILVDGDLGVFIDVGQDVLLGWVVVIGVFVQYWRSGIEDLGIGGMVGIIVWEFEFVVILWLGCIYWVFFDEFFCFGDQFGYWYGGVGNVQCLCGWIIMLFVLKQDWCGIYDINQVWQMLGVIIIWQYVDYGFWQVDFGFGIVVWYDVVMVGYGDFEIIVQGQVVDCSCDWFVVGFQFVQCFVQVIILFEQFCFYFVFWQFGYVG